MTIAYTRAAAVATAFMLAAFGEIGFAAKGGTPGPPDDQGDHGEELTGNRLSYPAVLIPGENIDPFFLVDEGELGVTFSYGCPGVEIIEPFAYPNISCVDDLLDPKEYYTADQCTAVGGKCEGLPVDRIYWQKEELNDWSAQATGISVPESLPVTVRYVDWGDSLEVVNWNEYSFLRVETLPFVDLGQDPLVEIPAGTQLGFQTWHVSGQGITEHWGVRVTEDAGLQGLPYAYQMPYAIINGDTAELYLSKLFPEAADDAYYACPGMGGGDDPPVYPADYPFDGISFTPGEGWTGACNLPVVDFTLEQNVSGKFVYGYNWRMRDIPNPLSSADCGDDTWQKTGWWRLTFVPNGGMEKMVFDAGAVTSAPAVPDSVPTDILLALLADEDETEGTLYTPVVDAGNNLTYLDICIVGKANSGGGGGKK